MNALFRCCIGAAVAVVALAAAACGGSDEENPYTVDQLAGFVTDLAAAGSGEIGYAEMGPGDISQHVSENAIGREWIGGHRMTQLEPAPGIDRILVTVELYDDEDEAIRRQENEASTLFELFQRAASDAARVDFDASGAGEGCQGLGVDAGPIVNQYQVHCRVGTLFIWARTLTQDEAAGQQLAIEAAREVVQRAQAALPTPESGS
jgi:hypothetical protein